MAGETAASSVPEWGSTRDMTPILAVHNHCYVVTIPTTDAGDRVD